MDMNRYSIRITIEGGGIMKYQIEKWEAMDLLVHVKTFNAQTSEKEMLFNQCGTKFIMNGFQ